MDQHLVQDLEALVERNCFSLGVLRGLLAQHVETGYAAFDGRCSPADIHGSFVSSWIRQNLWVDLQLHEHDPRGATLRAPGRRGLKLDYLAVTDLQGATLHVRKHPRRPYSTELEPVAAERATLDLDLFGNPVLAPVYVLHDVDLDTQALGGAWLATVSGFDDDARRVIHGRVPLPPAPTVLLPGTIEPLPREDAAELGFEDLLLQDEQSGDDPA